ncbi:MAG: hypothetical protein B7Z37_27300 [Verrucomicrobia bacterium 12-59-8]|nr:MAG: hypothetical protein B7Z37_27300 [Verrucomicrobia bacterium 12-59-8]
MSSFLWLLLYLAPLLGLTAALFAWFGWQWRGSDLQQRINELTARLDATQAALATPALQDPTADELQALRDALQSAQAEARLRQDEAAKTREAAQALETEMTRLLAELEQLRAAHSAAQAELDRQRSTAPTADEAAPAKPKRKRNATTAKPKARTASLRETITALEGQLSTHQAGLATLTQERDDWQRRISALEGQTPADSTGRALARRSFADREKRLLTTTSEIERLQNQTRVLLRVEETTAAQADVPDDDLTQIKGIKKITSDHLRAHGIRTWRQIALWDADELRAFSELLAFKNRAHREQWQQQARTLHEAAHGPLP